MEFWHGEQNWEPLLSHDIRVLRVAASRDGRSISSGALNGGILVCEVATRKSEPVLFKGHESDARSVIISPDSGTVIRPNGMCLADEDGQYSHRTTANGHLSQFGVVLFGRNETSRGTDE